MKRGSLLGRYWRGELPLNAYPASAIAFAVVLLLVFVPLIGLAGPYGGPAGVAFVLLGLWLFLPLALTFWGVASWRGAARAAQSPGQAGHAHAVRWMVLVPIALTGYFGLTVGLDQVNEAIRLIRGTAQGPPYTVRIVGERAIAIRGRIEFGLAARVGAVLAANPGVRDVHLSSPGGRAAEAKRVGALIAERRLATYATDRCYSACVIILMAGTERFLVQGAAIGLHRPGSPGRGEPSLLADALLEIARADWVALGIDPGLVDRALAVPFDRIWKPSVEELVAGRVITGMVPALPAP